MVHSKNKGAAGERQFASWLREHWGIEARRGAQFKGTPDSPDVITPLPINFEVKRCERFELWRALDQADADAGPDQIPVVAHRPSRRPWIFIMYADDAMKFAKAILEAKNGHENDNSR